jgi:MFS family permease
MEPVSARTVRRSTLLLAAVLTCLSGMVQLVVAVSTITLVLVTGVEGILGLGPAVFLVAGALAALPAGRAMDRTGRVPVLAVGCAVGVVACLVSALGAGIDATLVVLAGFVLAGVSSGTVLLARTAAADLYPPARRARGISLVLFGALFGAALGPLVFRPLLAGEELSADTLVLPYLAAAVVMVVALVLVLSIRPDPKQVALAYGDGQQETPAASLRAILARPGAVAAVVAAVTSFAVMVSVMNLAGFVVVDHGHHQSDVFTVISAHIVGMYALVLIVGDLVDRLGRRPALVGGLVIMAGSTLGLVWAESVVWTSVALFGLGIGWNVSYVAAAAELADIAGPAERGKLIGFTDLVSGGAGAALALAGGVAFSELGVAALAVGSTAIALVPALWMLLRRPPQPVPETV